jgi:colicin import membrane protein
MELIKVGKNTKNAESIKIPGNIKTAFKKYLKAQQTLDAETYKDVKVELLFASWLATFEASEEYKTVIAAADAQKEAAAKEKAEAAEARKAEAAKAKAEKQAKKIADLEEALAKAKAEAEAKTEEAEAQE